MERSSRNRPPDGCPGGTESREEGPERGRERHPDAALGPDGLGVLVPWASGPDPEQDGLVRLAAARLAADGTWEGWESAVHPGRGRDSAANSGPLVSSRVRRAFGVESSDVEHAPRAHEVWLEVREFLGARPVLAPDGEVAARWAAALDVRTGYEGPPLEILGLEEVALLLTPGRLALRRSGLVRALLPADARPTHEGALQPPHVVFALADLVTRFLGRGPTALAVAVRGWTHAAAGFEGTDPEAARRLALVLSLVDAPSRWGGAVDLFQTAALEDGALGRARAVELSEEDPLVVVDPAWTRAAEDEAEGMEEPPLPTDREDATPFTDEDYALLDDLFQVHLPRDFGDAGTYRKSQHDVSRGVARALGEDRFLLVHAPTGTGKTLAYLLPALIFARRHDVRIGVATYTRALQEQAMDREVPRALGALARAGVAPGTRVSTLKGREHSLCWRALRASTPSPGDEPEIWLGWTSLALFALSDVDGDLDRFPGRPPVRLRSERPWRANLRSLLRHVRARAGCCTRTEDRQRCAAEISRRRAERSHVVITNQSFALARPEFFRRIVFDECEHLHDQAGSAYSTRYPIVNAMEAVVRLHDPGDSASLAALDRLRRAARHGSALRGQAEAAVLEAHQLLLALSRLERELDHFEGWRAERLGQVEPRVEHALFRAYVGDGGNSGDPQAGALVHARARVAASAARLDGLVARAAEELESARVRRAGRVRRALELGRQDLAELGEALARWLPLDDEETAADSPRPKLTRTLFHDVERDFRGELVVVARVLFPDRLLGRHVLPKFGAAALVSATTRVGGSFQATMRYLGLDQLAAGEEAPAPSADEERPTALAEFLAATNDEERGDGELRVEYDPAEIHGDAPQEVEFERPRSRTVDTLSAPEVFDYSRVLVGAPRDLPAPSQSRAEWLAAVARWLPWIAARTGGRILGLFTSLDDVRVLAEQVAPAFRAASLPLLWQGMEGSSKEELAEHFREREEATLLGVDTFWYGADFPGDTLELLLLARLPYGVPDRFHHAQCAALGTGLQRQRIYLPRALAKFRQGFGRLMRRASDRGAVVVLDPRFTDRRHAHFLRELPLDGFANGFDAKGLGGGARLVRGDFGQVSREVLAHLERIADAERRGLGAWYGNAPETARDAPSPPAARIPPPEILDIDPGELPY